MRSYILTATMLLIGLAGTHIPAAQAAKPAACNTLAAVSVSDTTIHSAETVAAGAFVPPGPAMPGMGADFSGLPEFCRVTGSIKPSPDSDIGFEVWLPTANWNGKFLQVGNGGAAGMIVYGSLAEGLSRGYAAANTDTGHQGGMGDFNWAAGHPEKLIDYQYRAVHELTRVGKAITAARYDRAPEKSYWLGCSTGGRQGLKEAQEFPADYDAIVAGAPANNLLALLSLTALIQHETNSNGLTGEKLSLLKESAIAACDTADRVADRVISYPLACKFDPSDLKCASGQTTGCLSEPEVAAAKRLYAGLVDEDAPVDDDARVLFPGTGVGSEIEWGGYAMPPFHIGTSYYRNIVFQDPTWDPANLNPGPDLARAEQLDGGAGKAMDPDLSEFVARGGKLIMFHGTTDGMIPYRNTINYYESVVARLGAETAGDHVRLYLVPGMDHCSGGEGPFMVDWLNALEAWAEQGKAPGVLPGSHPAEIPGMFGAPSRPSKPYTRPVCPYPQIAKYAGSGKPAEAANFECAAP